MRLPRAPLAFALTAAVLTAAPLLAGPDRAEPTPVKASGPTGAEVFEIDGSVQLQEGAKPVEEGAKPPVVEEPIGAGLTKAPNVSTSIALNDRTRTLPTGWVYLRGVTAADLEARKKKGERLIDVEIHGRGADVSQKLEAPVKFDAVLVKNEGAYRIDGWSFLPNATLDGLKLGEAAQLQFPLDIERYALAGENKQRFAVILVPNSGNDGRRWYYKLSQSYPNLVEDFLKAHDARLTDVDSFYDPYGATPGRQWDCIAVDNSVNRRESKVIWDKPLTTVVDAVKKGDAQIVDLEPTGGNLIEPRFTAIVEKKLVPSSGWWWWTDVSALRMDELATDKCARIVDLQPWKAANGRLRYSLVMLPNLAAGEACKVAKAPLQLTEVFYPPVSGNSPGDYPEHVFHQGTPSVFEKRVLVGAPASDHDGLVDLGPSEANGGAQNTYQFALPFITFPYVGIHASKVHGRFVFRVDTDLFESKKFRQALETCPQKTSCRFYVNDQPVYAWANFRADIPKTLPTAGVTPPTKEIAALVDSMVPLSLRQPASFSYLFINAELPFHTPAMWPLEVKLVVDAAGKTRQSMQSPILVGRSIDEHEDGLYPIFRHPRCSTCHSMSTAAAIVQRHKTGFDVYHGAQVAHGGPDVSGQAASWKKNPKAACGDECHFGKIAGAPSGPAAVSEAQQKLFAEISGPLEKFGIEIGDFAKWLHDWRSPPAALAIDWTKYPDWKSICTQVVAAFQADAQKEGLSKKEIAFRHFHFDPRILWAVAVGETPNRKVLATAPPHELDPFWDRVDGWGNAGFPCPK